MYLLICKLCFFLLARDALWYLFCSIFFSFFLLFYLQTFRRNRSTTNFNVFIFFFLRCFLCINIVISFPCLSQNVLVVVRRIKRSFTNNCYDIILIDCLPM